MNYWTKVEIDGLRDNAIKSSENGQHKNAQSRPMLQNNNTCTHVKSEEENITVFVWTIYSVVQSN